MNGIALGLLALAFIGTIARVADGGPNDKDTSMSNGGIRVVLQGNELKPPARIYFATNSESLLPAGEPALDAFDADVAIRCGTLRLLLADLITALCGEVRHD